MLVALGVVVAVLVLEFGLGLDVSPCVWLGVCGARRGVDGGGMYAAGAVLLRGVADVCMCGVGGCLLARALRAPASLTSVLSCLEDLTTHTSVNTANTAKRSGRRVGEEVERSGAGIRAVVLWATDNDELAGGLAKEVVAGGDKVLVAVKHALTSPDRHDNNCWCHRLLPLCSSSSSSSSSLSSLLSRQR